MSTPAFNTSNEDRIEPNVLARQIIDDFRLEDLSVGLCREVLRALVRDLWGDLPPYSTLKAAEISVVEKATVGSGIVPVFMHPIEGRWYAVVNHAGTHYVDQRSPTSLPTDEDEPFFMIAGGFIDLSKTVGIPGLVEENDQRGEHPREGALRELMEEVVNDRGDPVLCPHPDRFIPMDALTLTFKSGERRLVIGHVVRLQDQEIQTILRHVARLDVDDIYRRACQGHTVNPSSGKPEVCRVDVVPLEDLATSSKLLHVDQRNLFATILRFLSVPTDF